MSHEAIKLRPVQADDLPVLERFLTEPETVAPFQWNGWVDARRWRRRWEQDGMLSADDGRLVIVRSEDGFSQGDAADGRGGAPLGFVGWRKVDTWGPSHSWNIGAQLFPEFRGRGAGTQAQHLLVRYLFAHTTVHRVEAETDAENTAERRSLEKAGFTFEGILRGRTFRDGRWRDAAVYGVLRDDLLPGDLPPSDR
ncbi:GNAT family N-acetyltransferase [Streptomyces huiliensis]|uniref:GNAT family N-acetyltransferase n=1 Tax=Streptomyces huiliensis TaxID=2876027 RepID=UPI001CBEA2A6|nr:GNAT family protein [Streptomyces huiliensis]MBZ4321523.1 GNAT family N-acetyltransferase [Streptomyces huiliensis]